MSQSIPSALVNRLARELPKTVTLSIYHISTPPTRSHSIYSDPPGHQPEKTYCESHFLAACINLSASKGSSKNKEVLIYAIEVLIYSTTHNTTFFVSKVDSSGYLNLLSLPKGTPSPIKTLSSNFLTHLINTHRRPNVESVVSLFARAQDQYLFPRSVEYSGKHVQDDRSLIHWWCRVLNSVIGHFKSDSKSLRDTVKGYLLVPGLDPHESLSFIPDRPNNLWSVTYPQLDISRFPGDVPPRCLIPHFLDDPKARLLEELDTEITKIGKTDGRWKSVRSVDQFWEMMACRQECSAGRLVGFLWLVFAPYSRHKKSESVKNDSQTGNVLEKDEIPNKLSGQHGLPENLLPDVSQASMKDSLEIKPAQTQQSLKRHNPQRKPLTGVIIPRRPRVKTGVKSHGLKRPAGKSIPLHITKNHRETIVFDEPDYKRLMELLLHLDFSTIERAASSSSRWIVEVHCAARNEIKESWGQTVTGTRDITARTEMSAVGVNLLDSGLVRKKRKEAPKPPTQQLPC